ncbi:Uncharacterised protein [uncultured archaeon]|nr:Uncharacterised protein [uncultured archaeon]
MSGEFDFSVSAGQREKYRHLWFKNNLVVMLDAAADFLYQRFVVPGYDWVDTPTYGIILGLALLYLVIPVVKRTGVKFDKPFVYALAPFVIFGATTRELVDRKLGVYALSGEYPHNFYLVSPTIFLTMFAVTAAILYASVLIQRRFKIPYYKPMAAVGLLFSLYNVVLILGSAEDYASIGFALVVFLLLSVLVFSVASVWKIQFVRREGNWLVIAAHLLDASATYVGVDLKGHLEQHVLPNLLIHNFGTAAVMFPLKLAVVLPALYVIDKEMADDETGRRVIKLAVFVLGAGPALRDLTLLLMG